MVHARRSVGAVGTVAIAIAVSTLGALAATATVPRRHRSAPGTVLVLDDFAGSESSFVDNTTNQWMGRHVDDHYVVLIDILGGSGGATTKLESPEPSVLVELSMRSPRTQTAAQHGPVCLTRGRTDGYAFVVDNGTTEWRILRLETNDLGVDEHAVGTTRRLHQPGGTDQVAVECTTTARGDTVVSGVVDGRVVGRHTFSPGVPSIGSVGFVAQVPKRAKPTSFVVDDLLVTVPRRRGGHLPASSTSDVDRLRALLGPVAGYDYASATLAPDDERFYSREVFGDPHLDRLVVQGMARVGMLTLAASARSADDTEQDLDDIVGLAWNRNGASVETVDIAGHPVRRITKTNLGLTVYDWLDRGVYGQLVAPEPGAAETFLAGFIAQQAAR